MNKPLNMHKISLSSLLFERRYLFCADWFQRRRNLNCQCEL